MYRRKLKNIVPYPGDTVANIQPPAAFGTFTLVLRYKSFTGDQWGLLMNTFYIFIAAAVIFCALPGIASAQNASDADRQLVQGVLSACPADWTTQTCLKAVSNANLVMAANYGSGLQQSGHANEAEQVKQHCAASTAATQGTFPAYAFRSAFTECANSLTDIVDATGQKPDPVLFPVLVTATLCLSNDQRCAPMTQQVQNSIR